MEDRTPKENITILNAADILHKRGYYEKIYHIRREIIKKKIA